MRRACDWHIVHARHKLLIRENLLLSGAENTTELQLLSQVLREEAKRHLDTVLHIMGCLDQGPQMSYIRAGLATHDRYLWAQTMETAIQHKTEGRLFQELAILYETERDGGDLGGEPPGRSLPDWLAWCQEYGSAWLADCARYCQPTREAAR